jgi:enamine deaminase RidA (YjgF/YER057c/UK114 family)
MGQMEKRQVNPWTWQDRAGVSQGWRVDGAETVIFVAGQGAVSADGGLVGGGDFEAQVLVTFENMATVLEQSGASLEDVVKRTVFLTDIGQLREYEHIRAELMPGPAPASTAVQIAALALPGMLIEVEAIAVL